MILADIGEIGVYFEGREFILRPSLYAMSRVGTKTEIVDVFMRVFDGDLAYSLAVIQACADEDIQDVFGAIDENHFFNEMFASTGEIVVIAQSLLKHGIIGDIERAKKDVGDNDEYSQEFDARAYVMLAVAHLGISEREAWSMTMTSIVGALQAKYPVIEDKKKVSDEVIKESSDWFDELKKARETK